MFQVIWISTLVKILLWNAWGQKHLKEKFTTDSWSTQLISKKWKRRFHNGKIKKIDHFKKWLNHFKKWLNHAFIYEEMEFLWYCQCLSAVNHLSRQCSHFSQTLVRKKAWARVMWKRVKERVTTGVWMNWMNFNRLIPKVVKSPPIIKFFLRHDWSPNFIWFSCQS